MKIRDWPIKGNGPSGNDEHSLAISFDQRITIIQGLKFGFKRLCRIGAACQKNAGLTLSISASARIKDNISNGSFEIYGYKQRKITSMTPLLH